MTVVLTGGALTLDEVVRVARDGERVELHPGTRERMLVARAVVEAHLDAGTPVYGMTTAALTGEARLLAQPVSFELPTTTIAEGIEDRMTFAPLAARRLAEMVALGERVVALELIVATRAVELRSPTRLGAGTAEVAAHVRERLGLQGAAGGRIDVEPTLDLVRSGALSLVGRS